MANYKASIKSIRKDVKRRERNIFRLTRLRNACKKVEAAIESNDVPAAQAALIQAQSDLARGVKHGVIKAGNASRKLSRLNTGVKKIATAK